jgi:hypothetical protein
MVDGRGGRMFNLEDVACVLLVKWSFLFGAQPATVKMITDGFWQLIKAGEDATLDLYDPGSIDSRKQQRAEWGEPCAKTTLSIEKDTAAIHIKMPLGELLEVSKAVMERVIAG